MAFSYDKYKESSAVTNARNKLNQNSTYKESSEVTNLKRQLDNNSTYKESASVINARNNLNALKDPGDYNSKYQGTIDNLMGQITNRKDFTYDLNGDALYQQYKDQYMTQGKLAMMDTIGQASALTGGYGNSYAASVGNQAYQSSLQQLNNIVPELYKLALDKYNQEGEDLYNQYNMYNQQEQADYGRYQDRLNQYNTDRNYLQSVYDNERSFDYDKFSENRAYYADMYNNARDFDYSKFSDNRSFLQNQYQYESQNDYSRYSDAYSRAFSNYQQGVSEQQYAKDYALKQAQLNEQIRANKANEAIARSKISTGGGGGSSKSSGSKGSGNTTTKTTTPTFKTYEDAAKYMRSKGIPGDGGLMTNSEWNRRKAAKSNIPETFYKSYSDYLTAFVDDKLN